MKDTGERLIRSRLEDGRIACIATRESTQRRLGRTRRCSHRTFPGAQRRRTNQRGEGVLGQSTEVRGEWHTADVCAWTCVFDACPPRVSRYLPRRRGHGESSGVYSAGV